MTTQSLNPITPQELVAIFKEDSYRDYEQKAYDFWVTLEAHGYCIIRQHAAARGDMVERVALALSNVQRFSPSLTLEDFRSMEDSGGAAGIEWGQSMHMAKAAIAAIGTQQVQNTYTIEPIAMGDASTRKDEEEVQNGQRKTNGDQPALIRTTSPANEISSEIPVLDEEIEAAADAHWDSLTQVDDRYDAHRTGFRAGAKLRQTKPVSVSLEDVFNKVILTGLYHNELFDEAEEYYKKDISTVLDAAGVSYE